MTNTTCPDPESHFENAAERLGFGEIVPADEWERVVAEAQAEITACEGH